MKLKLLRKLKLNRVDVVPAGANPGAQIEIVKHPTREEDGKAFPSTDFAHVPDAKNPDGWRLRLASEPGGEADRNLVKAAVTGLSDVPSDQMSTAKGKVLSAWLKANPDLDRDSAPEVLKMTKDKKSAEELQTELDAKATELEKAQADLKAAQDKADELGKSKTEEPEGEGAQVRKELDETKAELVKIQKEQRTQRFIKKAQELEHLPTEPVAKLLDAADEHFEDEQKELLGKFLAGANEQIEKGALFKQLADGSDPTPESFEQTLEKAARKVQESKPELTIEQAQVQAMHNDPALQKAYAEQRS